MEMKKKGLDKEMIITCAIIAAVASVGIVFGALLFLGIDATNCNATLFVASFFALFTGIWGILLCRNC